MFISFAGDHLPSNSRKIVVCIVVVVAAVVAAVVPLVAVVAAVVALCPESGYRAFLEKNGFP